MELEDLLILHEGKKYKVYKCSAGKDSIGVGHNIEDEPLPDWIQEYLDKNGKITDEMVDELLEKDIQDAVDDAWKIYPDLDNMSESRRNALIDFLFNVGYGTAITFKRFNTAVNEGKWKASAKLLLATKYARQVGNRAKHLAHMLEFDNDDF